MFCFVLDASGRQAFQPGRVPVCSGMARPRFKNFLVILSMQTPDRPSMGRYRWAVASRALAAAGGGYVLAASAAGALGLAFMRSGMARPDAVLASTMLSFVLYACAALWAFGCATAWRAWAGIGAPALVLGAVIGLFRLFGGAQP